MLRLLLKCVQNINGSGQPYGIDGSEGVAIMIGDDLQHSSRNVLKRLGVDVFIADLSLIKSKSNEPPYKFWKFFQRTMRIGNEDQLSHPSPSIYQICQK